MIAEFHFLRIPEFFSFLIWAAKAVPYHLEARGGHIHAWSLSGAEDDCCSIFSDDFF